MEDLIMAVTIPELQDLQRRMRTSTLRDNLPPPVEAEGRPSGMPVNIPPSARGMPVNMPPSSASPPQERKRTYLGDKLKEIAPLALMDLAQQGLSKEVKGMADRKQLQDERQPLNLRQVAAPALPFLQEAINNPIQAAHGGGLMRLAVNNEFSGQVPGRGHGMQDNVYMPIVERRAGEQVGTLAVSPDEYVVDAHTMSALGNGSADAGAEVMDRVVKNVRQKAFGTQEQPRQINGLAALRPMTERV